MDSYLKSIAIRYVSNYSGISAKCWTSLFLTLVNSLSIGVCFFLSIYFVNNLNINIALATLLVSAYGLGTIIGGYFSGKICDYRSPKLVSNMSLAIQSMSFLLLLKITSYHYLFIIMLTLGISSYGFKTSNNLSMLNEISEKDSSQRLKIINTAHAASNLGLGLSGIMIYLLSVYGFPSIFYFSASILFISLLINLRISLNAKNNSPIINKNKAEEFDASLKANNKIYIIVLMLVFMIGLVISQLSSTYPIYISNLFPKLGLKAVSILFLLDTFMIVLLQTPIVNQLNKSNKILIVGLGGFLMGLGMLILIFSFNFFIAIISCVIWTFGEMLFISMAQLICYERSNRNKKGQSMGAFQASFAASTVLGPVIGGYIYNLAGGDVIWYISLVIGIICLFVCLSQKNLA